MTRTFEPLELGDLRNLCPYADEEIDRFCVEVAAGKYSSYRQRLLAVLLVQGAGQHFVDSRPELKADHDVKVSREAVEAKGHIVANDGRVISGVKDVNILLLFDAIPAVPIPARNHCLKQIYATLPGLGERKIDLAKKSIDGDVTIGANDTAGSVRAYVQKTRHGQWFLSQKSVIGLYPEWIFGLPLWISRRWVQGHAEARFQYAA